MRNLSQLTDYRTSPNTSRIRELEKQMTTILNSEKAELEKFSDHFISEINKTDANVKAMRIAVSKSKQPGAVPYRQTPPGPQEIPALKSLISSLDSADSQLAKSREEVRTLLQKERSRWTQSASSQQPPKTLSEWLKIYGKPNRSVGPFERSLSLVSRPIHIVPGARSADGLVDFKTQRSQAMTLRLGNLVR